MSTRLTEAELARLEKLEAKATPGEWKVSEPAVYIYTADGMVAKMENCPEFKSNSEFIAALRNHAPALIAAARRAAVLEAAMKRIADMRTWAGVWSIDCECNKRLPQIFDIADAALDAAGKEVQRAE